MRTVWHLQCEMSDDIIHKTYFSFEAAKLEAFLFLKAALPSLCIEHTNMLCLNDPSIDCMQDAYRTYVLKGDTLSISIRYENHSGGKSNPLIVLKALQEKAHADYEDAQIVASRYETHLSERTFFRHIDLLRSLGYSIRRNGNQFTLLSVSAPIAKRTYGSSAYPIMLLSVLVDAKTPLLQKALIEEIDKRYGTVIHRKAIGGLIKTLVMLEYRIVRTKEGYSLVQL